MNLATTKKKLNTIIINRQKHTLQREEKHTVGPFIYLVPTLHDIGVNVYDVVIVNTISSYTHASDKVVTDSPGWIFNHKGITTSAQCLISYSVGHFIVCRSM